jgi:undecaprenyl-diphosphatase
MFWDKIKRNEVWVALAIIFTISVLVSGVVLDNCLDRDGLTIVDRPVNQLVLSLRNPLLDKLFFLITLTGNWQMIAWGSFLATVLLILAKKRRYLIAMLLSNISALIFIELAKYLVGRARPPVENALIIAPGFAFPSGHSYFAVVFYGLTTYFWVRHFHHRWAEIIMFVLGSTFIFLLAISRIYLGVHWFTDVLAGLSLSVAWLSIIVSYIEFKRRFFVEEYKSFHKKTVWLIFFIFIGLWLGGLLWLYTNNIKTLGVKIIRPISAETTEIHNTAPAAKSRATMVSLY